MSIYAKYISAYILFLVTFISEGQDCQFERLAKATDETTQGQELKTAMDNDPDLIDIWEEMDLAGLRNIDLSQLQANKLFKKVGLTELSTSQKDIEILSAYLRRSDKSIDDIASEIPANATTTKKWLGEKKIEPFLSGNPKIAEIKNNPPNGYNIYEDGDGTLYIRRDNTDDLYSTQLTVKNGIIVKYTGPSRVSTPGKLNSNLVEKYGRSMPDFHQGHHIVPDNVVQKSPLHEFARSKGWYDIDRASNGVWLAETADYFEDGVSKNLPNFPTGTSPTHLGPHSKYDKLVNREISNVLQLNGITDPTKYDFSKLSKDKIQNMIDDIEELATNILETWEPAHLN